MPLYIIVLWLEHIQNLHFFHQISIKCSYIFWCLILGIIFWVFGATWGQKGRFWEPLGGQLEPKWRPKSAKWRPKSAKWRQKPLKIKCWYPPGAIFSKTVPPFCRLAPKIAFGPLLGTTFVDFGWIWDGFGKFWWILASFFKDFGHVSAAAFAECQRRLARNEITENVKNMQITAEICKSQTQPKTH